MKSDVPYSVDGEQPFVSTTHILTTTQGLTMSDVQRYLLTVGPDKPKALGIAQDTAKSMLSAFYPLPKISS